jgi:hypothetical protein
LRASAIWKCFEKFESSLELISGWVGFQKIFENYFSFHFHWNESSFTQTYYFCFCFSYVQLLRPIVCFGDQDSGEWIPNPIQMEGRVW